MQLSETVVVIRGHLVEHNSLPCHVITGKPALTLSISNAELAEFSELFCGLYCVCFPVS